MIFFFCCYYLWQMSFPPPNSFWIYSGRRINKQYQRLRTENVLILLLSACARGAFHVRHGTRFLCNTATLLCCTSYSFLLALRIYYSFFSLETLKHTYFEVLLTRYYISLPAVLYRPFLIEEKICTRLARFVKTGGDAECTAKISTTTAYHGTAAAVLRI